MVYKGYFTETLVLQFVSFMLVGWLDFMAYQPLLVI